MIDAVKAYLSQREPTLASQQVEVFTGRDFVLARTSEGDIGVAMDYARYRSAEVCNVVASRAIVREILAPIESDVGRAVAVATLIAASRPYYRPEALQAAGLYGRRLTYRELRDVEAGSEHPLLDGLLPSAGTGITAGIVGFGGLLEVFAFDPRISQVLFVDRDTAPRIQAIQRVVRNLNAAVGRSKVAFVGADARALAGVDLIDITGSSTCNGSINALLDLPAGRRILHGPSAAFAPEVVFSQGIDLLVTELRPRHFPSVYLYDEHLLAWYDEYDDRMVIAKEPAHQPREEAPWSRK